VVCTTHLFWNPDNEDIKQVQIEYLLDRLERWQPSALPGAVEAGPLVPVTRWPLILAGDFNSTPDSSVYQYLTTGMLAASARPFWRPHGRPLLDPAEVAALPPGTLPAPGGPLSPFFLRFHAATCHHAWQLRSAYALGPAETAGPYHHHHHHHLADDANKSPLGQGPKQQQDDDEGEVDDEGAGNTTGEPEFTNYTPKWQGTIDYIFYSPQLERRWLAPLPSEAAVAAEGGGLPNSRFSSDHLPLVADLAFRSDTPSATA
jgi:endonuclease/exonuclease/phosphatase family metal-dependent hydrolase